jgi:ELWxxDGT repeat protein
VDTYYPNAERPEHLTNVNGVLYFTAGRANSATANQIWRTDGTQAGTEKLRNSTSANALTNVNGALFFHPGGNSSLWRHDSNGFAPITSTPVIYASALTSSAETLVIGSSVYVGSSSFVYRTDGATAEIVGTPGLISANTGRFFAAGGDEVFFRGSTSSAGAELWNIDHPSGSALQLRDIKPGAASAELRYVGVVGETIIFLANDGTHGLEFWKSNGTSEGTSLLKEITPGTKGALAAFTPKNINGALLFMTNDGLSSSELWRSDGTTAGTFGIKDLAPGSGHAYVSPLVPFLTIGSTAFFTSYAPSTGELLWKTDGTAQGTIDVTQWVTSKGGSSAEILGAANSKLYLSVYDATRGRELWVTDGASAGTSLVKSIMPGNEGS